MIPSQKLLPIARLSSEVWNSTNNSSTKKRENQSPYK
jgi:hypothetical protein